ncbi:MAG: PAS domain S-box protein [bacterium]
MSTNKREYNMDRHLSIIDTIAGRVSSLISKSDRITSPELAEELQAILDSVAEARDEITAMSTKARRNLGNVLRKAPIGICVTDKSGMFEYVNSSYCNLYGYTSEELLGRHFTTVVKDAEREMFIDLHDRFLGRQYELRGEWEVVDKWGQVKTILASAAYIVEVSGEPKKITFVVDISERKRMEAKLNETIRELEQEIEKRSQLEQSRDRVERIVRHDLKNPLNGVLGGTQLLMMDELTEEQKSVVTMMNEAGRQMLRMLDNSFDYLRMEDGTYQPKFRQFSVLDTLKMVETEVSEYAAQSGVLLRFSCNGVPLDRSEDYTMTGEKQHIVNMLGNLVRNAIEASRAGKAVSLTAEACTGGEASPSDRLYLYIDIHNSGVIPADIRNNFFDRYVTSGKKNGTGLGTYLAKLVTEFHNGRIDFTTDEQEGTHLLIWLPCNPNPDNA